MYQYPDQRQTSFGSNMQNPRGFAPSGYTPVNFNNGGAMAGAYDNQQVMPMTVGQFREQALAPTSNTFNTFGLDGTVNTYGDGIGNNFQAPNSNLTEGGFLAGLREKYNSGIDIAKDQAKQGAEQVGANVGQMNFAQKGSALLGGVKGVWDAYNAHKTNKIAKEQLAFTKDSFNRNFTAQAKTTNAQLADRQNARHKRDPNTFASVSDYMKKYGV